MGQPELVRVQFSVLGVGVGVGLSDCALEASQAVGSGGCGRFWSGEHVPGPPEVSQV
jgi:hypothetical protein